MKKTSLLTSVLFTLLLTGCSSTLIGVPSTPIIVSSNTRPLDADITVDVNKKIAGESSASYFLLFKMSGDSKFAEGVDFSVKSNVFSTKIAKIKSAALYNAVNDSKCDLIVHPNYVVEVNNLIFFKKIKVKVTGYAGTINKIQQQK